MALKDGIKSVAFSPDGHTLVVASLDKNIWIYDTKIIEIFETVPYKTMLDQLFHNYNALLLWILFMAYHQAYSVDLNQLLTTIEKKYEEIYKMSPPYDLRDAYQSLSKPLKQLLTTCFNVKWTI